MEEEDLEASLLSSVNRMQHSGIYAENIEDLPAALTQLDECLKKSNANVFELKESLKLVLEREEVLHNDYETLWERHEFLKRVYSGKQLALSKTYAAKLRKFEDTDKKLKKAQETQEKQRKRLKEQESELQHLHERYLSEQTEHSSTAKDNDKLKSTVEKLHEAMQVLNEEAQTWKDRTTKLRTEFYEKENELSEVQEVLALEKKQSQRLQNKLSEFEEALKDKEQRWKSKEEERKKNDHLLQRKYEALKKKAHDEIQEVAKLKKENEQLNLRAESLQNEAEENKKRYEKTVGERKQLTEELEVFQKELENKEKSLRESQEKKDKQNKELQTKNKKLEESLEHCQRVLEEKQLEIKGLKTYAEQTQLDAAQKSKSKESEVLQLREKLSKTEKLLSGKTKCLEEMETSFNQLSEKYTDLLWKLKESEESLKGMQSCARTTEAQYEDKVKALTQQINETKQAYEDHIEMLKQDYSRLESELRKAKYEYTTYETTTKRAHSEVELWKAGLLEVACFRVLEKPKVEDVLRALLGVAPERLSGYDQEQAEYVWNVISKMKEALQNQEYLNPSTSNQALDKTSAMLREMTEKYRQEMAERRRLHALLQELRGNIRVMCRVRPLLKGEREVGECVHVADTCQVKVLNSANRRESSFEFDRAFPPTDSQEVVYYEVSDIVTSVMNGYNACIMAYGQTGSGKTYTMEGNLKGLGINYRAVKELFEIADSRSEHSSYCISISIIEVYNETIRDLLKPSSKRPEIRENSEGVVLQNIGVERVASYADIVEAIERGKLNRSVGCTNINEYSSRSHCIVTIYVDCTSTERSFQSKLNLIDLAGSERVWKSEAEGQRMTEACNINQSLSALGKVLYNLAAKQSHIPYRDSKLTHLLKDSLSGDAKTLMIVTVSPSQSEASETCSSLSFGARVACVEKGKAKQNDKSKKPTKKGRPKLSEAETSAESYLSPRIRK